MAEREAGHAAAPPETAAAQGIGVIAYLLGIVAGLGIAFMALATTYDVFARYLFNRPTIWATEISTYVLVATIFFGAGRTHLRDGHVRVDVVLNALRPSLRHTLLLVAAWVGMLVVTITGWQAALLVVSEYRSGARLFSLLLTPSWMPKLPIAIGLIGLAAALLVEIERLAAARAAWRRWLPYALFGLVIAPLLVAYGARPPTLLGTRFDAGSLAVLLAVYLGAWVTGGPRVVVPVIAATLAGIAAFHLGKPLGVGFLSAMLCLAIAVGLAAGVRIAFALGLVGMLSIYFLTPAPFPITLAERAWSSVNSFALTAVPMFVLMGALLVRSGLSRELFTVMAALLSRFPGGLAHAGTAGCTVFSAVSGSSVATAATIGAVACPEMSRRGYDPRLTYGTIAAGGTLGILIPPSVPLIIYGITVGVPITTLFIAGILPGLLMVSLFAVLIMAWALLDPRAAPAVPAEERARISRKSLVDTGIVVMLIALIILSLYAGLATPSETGAVAAVLAYLACLLRGRMSWGSLLEAIAETVLVTSFIFLLIVGAHTLTFGFDYLRVSQALMSLAAGADLNRWVILAVILAIYLVLGMFLDSISMLVLTLPVVFPLAQFLGFDPVWLGVVLVIMAEIGLITPPVGMNLFVLQGVSREVPIRTIAIGTLPFIGVMFLSVALLCLFPGIALWLTAYIR